MPFSLVSLYELILISPSPTNVFFLKIVQKPFKKYLTVSSQKMSFNRVGDMSDALRISCDWCAIVTVCYHAILLDSPKDIDSQTSRFYMGFLQMAKWFFKATLLLKTPPVDTLNEFVNRYPNPDKIVKSKVLTEIAYIALCIEELELKWCPFKALAGNHYRSDDNRYVPISHNVVKSLKEWLRQNDSVKCYACNNELNAMALEGGLSLVEPQNSYLYEIATHLLDIPKESID